MVPRSITLLSSICTGWNDEEGKIKEGGREGRKKRKRTRMRTALFSLSNMLEFAAYPKNIHSERATSSGHKKEIQELLFLYQLSTSTSKMDELHWENTAFNSNKSAFVNQNKPKQLTNSTQSQCSEDEDFQQNPMRNQNWIGSCLHSICSLWEGCFSPVKGRSSELRVISLQWNDFPKT